MVPTPISSAAVTMIVFTASTAISVPFVVWFILSRGRKGYSPSILTGAFAFFLADLVLRFQFVRILQSMNSWNDMAANQPVLALLITVLLSTLFSSGARYFLMRDDNLYFESAVGAGLGFGGLNSIANTGVSYISYFLLASTINNAKVVPEGMEQTAELLAETPAVNFLLIGVECILLLAFQMFLMVLLCKMVLAGRGTQGVILTGTLQFAVTFLLPLLQQLGLPLWSVELLFLPVAALSILQILRMRKTMPSLPKKVTPSRLR